MLDRPAPCCRARLPASRSAVRTCVANPRASAAIAPAPPAPLRAEPSADVTAPPTSQPRPAPDVDASVAKLKLAVRAPGAVPGPELVQALVAVEKSKLKADGWEALLTAPGARWRLFYTVPGKDVTAASKKQKGGAGSYFPLTGCQKFEGGEQTFENGVFLGPLAHLTFKGPFKMASRYLWFDVTTMYLGVGPWRVGIPLKRDAPPSLDALSPKDLKALPFFIYAFVDEDIIVARGRSGGVALWGRADPEWAASAGVLQVYK